MAREIDEIKLDGSHFILACTITDAKRKLDTHTLVDCGASGFSFVDGEFVRQHNLPLFTLAEPRRLEVIDGRPIDSGDITHIVKIGLNVGGHRETLSAFVTQLGHYPLVLGIPWLRHHDPTIRWAAGTLTFDSARCTTTCAGTTIKVQALDPPPARPTRAQPPKAPEPTRPLSIAAVSLTAFRKIAKKEHRLHDKASTFAISAADIEAMINPPEKGEPPDLPEEYRDFGELFSESEANKLPPHRPGDHRIDLKEGTVPSFGPLYSLSRQELEALRKWLDENLAKGFIRTSSSSAGAPILFVKKKDGSLRLCVDYRDLNEKTIKNRYPLPLIQETLMQLSKAKWYTKLDIRGAYNLIRMKEGDEWKTAFRTRYGLFESLVMPFGLTNAPATFQAYINETLAEYLDRFCSAFLDDTIIYSETYEEHVTHVRQVLAKLAAAGLHLNPKKCEFHRTEITYLGLVIGRDGIRMQPEKVEAIRAWEPPTNLTDVRSFVGFANFYRRFIHGFSSVIHPLTNLTRKGVKFKWEKEQQLAFEELKQRFTSAPVLAHFDFDRDVVVETDASDYVSAGVLSQYDDAGILHPVAFFSTKHSPAECNYEIYDKELMAIVRAFEHWRAELQSVENPIQVLSDHKNLEYFMSTKLLNRRQARWAEYLSRFNFKITYRPGNKSGKPDALTRRSEDLPGEGGDARLQHMEQTVLKPHQLQVYANWLQNIPGKPPRLEKPQRKLRLLADNPPGDGRDPLKALLEKAYETDKTPSEVLQALKRGDRRHPKVSLAECEDRQGTLFYRGRIFVPDHDELRLHIIQNHHSTPAFGHPGRAKTLELIQREYYWQTMRKDVDRFVRNCEPCRRSRTVRHSPFGLLRQPPIPRAPWQDISMDFVVGLPWSEGFNAIWVVVDRLTKQRHLIPCRGDVDAKDLADLFLQWIFRLHGLPETIISDRGTQFASHFWGRLCERLQISRRMSTAFHPETDGQTERLNAVMEQYLRAYVNYLQDDWSSWLPLAEFAANNQVSEATNASPFFALHGYHPRATTDLRPAEAATPGDPDALAAATALQEIHDHLRTEMGRAQAIQAENSNRRRTPAPIFRAGDRVWLDARNITTCRPSKKLDHRRLGPYEVIEAVGPNAARLRLPETVRLHPVFHVSLLEHASDDPLPGQQSPPPPAVIVDGQEEWEVERVLDSRLYHRRLQYLVKWRG